MAGLLPPNKLFSWRFLALALAAVSLAVLAAVSLASGCGGTVFVASSNGGRLLVFVSVTPASADPSLSNGQVIFTASGTFNTNPTTISPLTGVIWTVDQPAFSNFPNLGRATITQDGLAQCGVGFVGTVKVFATAAADPTLAVSLQNQKVGTATLVCP
jgi:hypothetical protein